MDKHGLLYSTGNYVQYPVINHNGEDIKKNRERLYIHMEKAMAPHSSTLAWKMPWTEEPGRLQSMGSQRVRHDRATSLSLSLVKMSTAIKVYTNQVETIRCDKEDKHEEIKQVSVMQGYWIHWFSLHPSNLDWNSK